MLSRIDSDPLHSLPDFVQCSECRQTQHEALSLQRYLMRYLTKASFPVREIGTVMTLLHARYELEDLIRTENFQG